MSEKRWAIPIHRVGQFEFPTAVEADPVRTMFDCEHTAEVTVAAAKDKLESRLQQFHKF